MIDNETMRSILARRSYKSFKSDPISDDILETILAAGKYAPNGMNRQAWHFTVVKSAAGKSLFKAACEAMQKRGPAMPPPPKPPPNVLVLPEDEFRGAPVLILISGEASAEISGANCIGHGEYVYCGGFLWHHVRLDAHDCQTDIL